MDKYRMAVLTCPSIMYTGSRLSSRALSWPRPMLLNQTVVCPTCNLCSLMGGHFGEQLTKKWSPHLPNHT